LRGVVLTWRNGLTSIFMARKTMQLSGGKYNALEFGEL
jgi:hypothetical protein